MDSSWPGRNARRRFSIPRTRPKVARRVSRISRISVLTLHLAIAAAEIEERDAIARSRPNDFADENRMIAAGKLIVDRAFERGQRARNERHAELAALDVDPGELVVRSRSKSRRDIGLIGAEDADAELPGSDDCIVRFHAFFDADEHEWRAKRKRCKGSDCHPVRPAAMFGRHDRHATGKMRHRGLESRLINGHDGGSLTFSEAVRTTVTKEITMARSRIALVAFFLIATAAYAVETPTHRTFNVAPGGTLTIDTDVGNIRVDTGGSAVTIDVTQRTRVSNRRLELTFDQQQNNVTVRGKLEPTSRWFNWSDDEANFVVTVPARYNVNLKTSGGDIRVGNLQGQANVRTSGGGIQLGNVGGQVVAHTSGGDVALESSSANVDLYTSGGGIRIGDVNGSVTAKTSGGSIEIRRAAGDLLARTSGGGITIGEADGTVDARSSGGWIQAQLGHQPRADSRLSTSGGGITISIAPNVSVDLDAHTSGGDVDTDVPVTLLGKQDESSLQGKINSGGPKLLLRSSGGNIHIKRQ